MIELKNITYKINGVIILDNINLQINQKDFLVVLGLNGAGKSKLALLLAGLIEDFEGTYLLDQQKVKSDDIAGKKVGIIFQEPENQFFASIVENDLAFGLENKQIGRSEMQNIIDDNLTKMELQTFKKRNINLLSGGEKQKIATLAMLILDFNYLIFDESTSMLDHEGARNLNKFINKLHQEGKTIIMITHNLEELKRANRVIILKEGRVAEDLKRQDLTETILSKYQLS